MHLTRMLFFTLLQSIIIVSSTSRKRKHTDPDQDIGTRQPLTAANSGLTERKTLSACFNEVNVEEKAREVIDSMSIVYDPYILKQQNCSICQEEFKPQALNEIQIDSKTMWTQCGHMFHRGCLLRWLTSGCIKMNCPVCRQDLQTVQD